MIGLSTRTRAWLLVLPLTVALPACGSNSAQGTPSPTPFSQKATVVVTQLAAGQFHAIEASFDATMTAQLSEAVLANNWRGFQELLGKFKSADAPTEVSKGALTVERVTVHMAGGDGEVRITYHTDGTIAGLFFLKSGAPPP
jgi:hypothetical protein